MSATPRTPVDLIRAAAPHLPTVFASLLATGLPGALAEVTDFPLTRWRRCGAVAVERVALTPTHLELRTSLAGLLVLRLTWDEVLDVLREATHPSDRGPIIAVWHQGRRLHRAFHEANDVAHALGANAAAIDPSTRKTAQRLAGDARSAYLDWTRDVLRPLVAQALERGVDPRPAVDDTADVLALDVVGGAR